MGPWEKSSPKKTFGASLAFVTYHKPVKGITPSKVSKSFTVGFNRIPISLLAGSTVDVPYMWAAGSSPPYAGIEVYLS